MNLRRIETVVACFTLGALVVYVPVETYVSLPHGLLSPFYLIDAIAMVLMLWGAVHSLRARPACAPGLLCGAYGWAAANGWCGDVRAAGGPLAGGELDYGHEELWAVGGATTIALVCFAVLLRLRR